MYDKANGLLASTSHCGNHANPVIYKSVMARITWGLTAFRIPANLVILYTSLSLSLSLSLYTYIYVYVYT